MMRKLVVISLFGITLASQYRALTQQPTQPLQSVVLQLCFPSGIRLLTRKEMSEWEQLTQHFLHLQEENWESTMDVHAIGQIWIPVATFPTFGTGIVIQDPVANISHVPHGQEACWTAILELIGDNSTEEASASLSKSDQDHSYIGILRVGMPSDFWVTASNNRSTTIEEDSWQTSSKKAKRDTPSRWIIMVAAIVILALCLLVCIRAQEESCLSTSPALKLKATDSGSDDSVYNDSGDDCQEESSCGSYWTSK